MSTPLVLYAGETGNAEEVAYDVQAKLPLSVRIMNIAQFDVLELPSEKHILFIVSTTGDGDIPEGMKSFWNFMLRRGLSSTSLADLSFSVLGLGDSSYDKYNAAARKLQKRLLMLGAKELVPMGLGDDQATYGYFTAYNTWLESLRNTLAPAPAEGLPSPVKKTTVYSIQHISSDTNMDVEHSNNPVDAIVLAEVVENKRLTADVWAQDVRHLRLRHTAQISNRYAVGDVALVHYCNPPELVQQAAAMICEGGRLHEGCEYTLNTVLSINCTVPAGVAARPSRLSNLPHCTLGTLLERHLDIGAVPKRSYFAALAPYATSTEEADKLRELASAQGTDLYHDYCIRERKSYVEVLQEFRSCRPPLAVLLGAIQLICPRQYSIACAPLTNPHELELCVAVSTRRTPYGRKRTGLCSGYIARLRVGDAVRISFRHGAIRNSAIAPQPTALPLPVLSGLPTPPTSVPTPGSLPQHVPMHTPLILIGPGTGVAPMRALIQQHCLQTSAVDSASAASAGAIPSVLLFFGCRKEQRDFLYGSEWAALNNDRNPFIERADGGEDGLLQHCGGVRVVSAFSQDQLVKHYVTHRIAEHVQTVCAMLLQGAAVFVAGSAKKMPGDVHKSLSGALQAHAGLTEVESREFLARLAKAKKYVVEAWS